MSTDISMLSDDDVPLRANGGASGVNGNGHVVNGKRIANESSPLSSEDEEMPLVRVPTHVACTSRAPVDARTDGCCV